MLGGGEFDKSRDSTLKLILLFISFELVTVLGEAEEDDVMATEGEAELIGTGVLRMELSSEPLSALESLPSRHSESKEKNRKYPLV